MYKVRLLSTSPQSTHFGATSKETQICYSTKQKGRITALEFRRADCGLCKDLLGRTAWIAILEKKRGLGVLVDLQESPPPNTRTAHPDKQDMKQRQHEACMGEHGAPDTTQRYNGRVQVVEAESGDPGGL